jgi:hypothetical protein
MPFVDTSGLDVIERLPGSYGRYFHSPSVARIAGAGLVAIVPANVRHSVKALTDGRVIIVDYPRRRGFADA